MKTMMFAAAIMLSGAALAQSTSTGTQSTTGQSMQTQPMQTQPMQTQPMQTQPAPMDQSSQPMPSTQPAPDTTMSDPNAQAPAGTMAEPQTQPMMDSGNMATQGTAAPMNGNMAGMAMPAATTGAYPRCSRTVTDRCIQGGPARRR